MTRSVAWDPIIVMMLMMAMMAMLMIATMSVICVAIVMFSKSVIIDNSEFSC